MLLKNLLSAVDALVEMPIEIEELAGQLTQLGCQDEIIFFADNKLDPSVLRGIHYKYTTRDGVYAAPNFTTLIVYASKLDLGWQRIVCCKELIHTCDTPAERTKTEEEVQGLLDKLLGPLSTENFGAADIMATKDKLALYQALAVLFPVSAREQALEGIKNGRTGEQIADWIKLPVSLVDLVLHDSWPGLREVVVEL